MGRRACHMESALDTGACVKHPFHVQNDVRTERLARGLSQAALGRALGVSRQTVNSIETGRYTPSLPLAIALARYFSKTVEEVFHVQD